MTRLIIVILCISFCNTTNAQYFYSWKKWRLRYESPFELYRFKSLNSKLYIAINSIIDVSMKKFRYDVETEDFKKDIRHAVKKMADQMQVNQQTVGDSLPKIKEGYYITGNYREYDSRIYPVVVVAITNKSKNQIFCVRFDCYNYNLEQGIKMAKSLEFY